MLIVKLYSQDGTTTTFNKLKAYDNVDYWDVDTLDGTINIKQQGREVVTISPLEYTAIVLTCNLEDQQFEFNDRDWVSKANYWLIKNWL